MELTATVAGRRTRLHVPSLGAIAGHWMTAHGTFPPSAYAVAFPVLAKADMSPKHPSGSSGHSFVRALGIVRAPSSHMARLR
jgi:hypothetical protein